MKPGKTSKPGARRIRMITPVRTDKFERMIALHLAQGNCDYASALEIAAIDLCIPIRSEEIEKLTKQYQEVFEEMESRRKVSDEREKRQETQ